MRALPALPQHHAINAVDGVQFGFVLPAGVASYITIAATMPCVHTATTANILPQSSAPNTGSNISPSASRARGDATSQTRAGPPAGVQTPVLFAHVASSISR